MSKLTAIAGAGIATVALTFALVGCGSDTKTDETTSKATTSKETTSEQSTSAKAEPTALPQAGTHKTIADYVKENNIQETMLKRGDPGVSIDLPVPDGWKVAGDLPEAPYGAIAYSGTSVPDNPPRILAKLSKLNAYSNEEEAGVLADATSVVDDQTTITPE